MRGADTGCAVAVGVVFGALGAFGEATHGVVLGSGGACWLWRVADYVFYTTIVWPTVLWFRKKHDRAALWGLSGVFID